VENFLATLVFVLPGLLAYYWMKAFGVEPSEKHNFYEMTAISVLLWVPVTVLNLFLYNLVAFINHKVYKLTYISDLSQIQNYTDNIRFLVGYLLISSITSFLIAYVVTGKIYDKFLALVNGVRGKRNLSRFSKMTTVWAEFIVPYGVKVVGISKLGDPQKEIIGCIRKASRPSEPERNLVLDDIEDCTTIVKNYKVPVIKVYTDTRSGVVVRLFDPDKVNEAMSAEGMLNES